MSMPTLKSCPFSQRASAALEKSLTHLLPAKIKENQQQKHSHSHQVQYQRKASKKSNTKHKCRKLF